MNIEHIDESVVLRVMRKEYWGVHAKDKDYRKKPLGEFDGRKFKIFYSDGYGSLNQRTAFFSVEGSPNKIFGYISHIAHRFDGDIVMYNCNHKNGRLDLRKEIMKENYEREFGEA